MRQETLIRVCALLFIYFCNAGARQQQITKYIYFICCCVHFFLLFLLLLPFISSYLHIYILYLMLPVWSLSHSLSRSFCVFKLICFIYLFVCLFILCCCTAFIANFPTIISILPLPPPPSCKCIYFYATPAQTVNFVLDDSLTHAHFLLLLFVLSLVCFYFCCYFERNKTIHSSCLYFHRISMCFVYLFFLHLTRHGVC